MDIGIVGGTGPAGSALALALAGSGLSVAIGSRDAAKAESIASKIRAQWSDRRLSLSGDDNLSAASADMVVLATPWSSAVATATDLAPKLQGKILISMVNAMERVAGELRPIRVACGSIAQAVASAVPDALVVTAFQHLAASKLERLESPLQADVLLCSDYRQAIAAVSELVRKIPNLRPIEVGSLAMAGVIEDLTSVLVNVNIRYKTTSSVMVTGVDSPESTSGSRTDRTEGAE